MSVDLNFSRRVERLLFDRHDTPVKPANWLFDVLRYPFALIRDLLTGELNLRAMGLVYTTLLSLVPLVAFAFAILKGLGIHRDLEPLIYEFLRPIGERAGELTTQMMTFVDNVRGGVLGSVGLAFLLYTVVTTIQKLEDAFNFAWHVERPAEAAKTLDGEALAYFLTYDWPGNVRELRNMVERLVIMAAGDVDRRRGPAGAAPRPRRPCAAARRRQARSRRRATASSAPTSWPSCAPTTGT